MRIKRYTYIIIAFLSLLSPHALGQVPSELSLTLSGIFTRILNSNRDNERKRLNDSLVLLMDSYTASDSVLNHKIDNVRYLGQIVSPDSRLKIITWNLILRDVGNKYFCYLIVKGSKGQKNKVYRLTGENRDEAESTGLIYTEKDWYGALYYAIQPFTKDGIRHYLLLGIDYGNSGVTRKIIDVLTINPDGRIVFGEKCFNKDNEISSRVVIEYSSEAVVSLRMKNSKCAVFDHLVSVSDDHRNDPKYMGSEFSFDGYVRKKGMWMFVSNIDVRNKKK